MKTINVENFDREQALLLYKNNIYINDNHQFAFVEALKNEGKKLDYDLDIDIDKVAELTNKKSIENEICTLDLYVDKDKIYLISHFKDNLMLNIKYLKTYANENNYILGYFKNFEDDDIMLL